MTEAYEVVRRKVTIAKRDGKPVQGRLTIPYHWLELLGFKEGVEVRLEFYPEEGKVVVVFPRKDSSSE